MRKDVCRDGTSTDETISYEQSGSQSCSIALPSGAVSTMASASKLEWGVTLEANIPQKELSLSLCFEVRVQGCSFMREKIGKGKAPDSVHVQAIQGSHQH